MNSLPILSTDNHTTFLSKICSSNRLKQWISVKKKWDKFLLRNFLNKLMWETETILNLKYQNDQIMNMRPITPKLSKTLEKVILLLLFLLNLKDFDKWILSQIPTWCKWKFSDKNTNLKYQNSKWWERMGLCPETQF